jgi:hypothetical protein
VQNQAEALKAQDSTFKYQKRVMDGGTCEATAFNCHGFQVAGMSVPLFNYHNIQKKGAKPGPEAVAHADVEGVVKLAARLMREHKPEHARTLKQTAYRSFLDRLAKNQSDHEKYFDGF